MPQQQVQKQGTRKTAREDSKPASAPTVNKKISQLWFREDNS